MIFQTLEKQKLIHPPHWLSSNCFYLTYMGSVAYGVSDDTSDVDIYGFAIPTKEMVFPHLAGKILGFDKDLGQFDQYQQHHIKFNEKTYDFTVFNIVRYFALLMENNPNIIDSLFTPVNCVIHSTYIANLVRDNRKIFLHKGAWHRFKGYAYSQLHKVDTKNPELGTKRKELREKYGTDTKFLYHVVRLIGEIEQILITGDLNLQLDNDRLKAIRRGEWTEQQVKDWFSEKEKNLEILYHQNTTLPWGPDINKIRKLLLDCLEHHFGNLEKAIVHLTPAEQVLIEIKQLLDKNNI